MDKRISGEFISKKKCYIINNFKLISKIFVEKNL